MPAASPSHAGAVLACTIAMTALLPARAESLRTITDVWGGNGNGNIAQGCTVYAPLPDLEAFFNGGGFRVAGGNAACGYGGVTSDQTSVTGPLVRHQILAPVALDNVGGSYQGSAGARAGYRSLGVESAGMRVGTPGGTTAAYAASAAFFSDTLTASSPLVAPAAAGFVRYVFSMDGSLSAPAGQGGSASVQLNIRQGAGQVLGLGRLGVQDGHPGLFYAIDGNAGGWTLGGGSVSGSGSFGSTVHVPFFGDVDMPMTWGSPWDLTAGLLALSAHTSDASFYSTANLVEVQLFDASHRRITDATLSAASGTDYLGPLQLAPVPELPTWAMLLMGWIVLSIGSTLHPSSNRHGCWRPSCPARTQTPPGNPRATPARRVQRTRSWRIRVAISPRPARVNCHIGGHGTGDSGSAVARNTPDCEV